jgi:L-lactate dehydrogenase complex protein LldE
MLRELRIQAAPLNLLTAVDGVDIRPWSADERCCGFGGLFSIKLPETSVAMADDKLASIAESGAELVVGCDSSCLLHLRNRAEHTGRPIRTKHLAEVLAEAIERGPSS